MKRLMAVFMLLASAACGSAPMPVVVGAPGHRDVLYEAEIQSNRTPGMTVYDLISHLRPEYLRSRGSNSLRNLPPPTAIVYLDGVRYGELETMKSLSAESVAQIQYLSASNATTRYGTDHTGGAILVTTRVH